MIFHAEAVITPREGVLDTQGKAVEKTLTHLGYEGLSEVRVGRIVTMRLEAKDGDAAADFYLYAVAQLEKAGYQQYEISNFCRPGHEGRHNLLYWDCCDYQGYGPAAHSCVGRVRKYWPDDVQAFIKGTAAEAMEGDCTAEDFLLMQLRLRRGLSLAEYGRWGGSFTSAQKQFIRQCVAHGYAEFDEKTLRLTPAGMVVQNSILTELM